MDVETLLRSKGQEVASVRPDQTVADAVVMLTEKNFGALVVSSDGQSVDGIVSERDIVRTLAQRGPDLLEDSVASIATSEVSTCSLTDTVDALMSQMTSGRFRHVPVVEDGRLVGVVSIGDVVKHRVAELEETNEQLNSFISGVPR